MKKPKILNLRPSQFVLGMKEVDAKIEKIRGLDRRGLTVFCREHVIPVVRGPKNELYVIDHHHFLRACWEMNLDCYSIKIIKDMSEKSERVFWKKMMKKGWTYLRDQFGSGPHPPASLPCDIRYLADDPYRSLVWLLIAEGFIEKLSLPFFEFKWASFFRSRLKLQLHGKSDFSKILKRAKRLATSRSARGIPGYLPTPRPLT